MFGAPQIKVLAGSLGRVAKTMLETSGLRRAEITDEQLFIDVETANAVRESATTKGFAVVIEFNKMRREEIIHALKYSTSIDKQERILLQGELIGLEGFQKTFEMTLSAGENAQRMLDERAREKAKHGR